MLHAQDLSQPEPLNSSFQKEAEPLIQLFGEYLTNCVYSKDWESDALSHLLAGAELRSVNCCAGVESARRSAAEANARLAKRRAPASGLDRVALLASRSRKGTTLGISIAQDRWFHVVSKTGWALHHKELGKATENPSRGPKPRSKDQSQLLAGYVVVLKRMVPDKNVQVPAQSLEGRPCFGTRLSLCQVFLAAAALLHTVCQAFACRQSRRMKRAPSIVLLVPAIALASFQELLGRSGPRRAEAAALRTLHASELLPSFVEK